MIVRILEDGQYEVDQQAEKDLSELDATLGKALDAGDVAAFDASLAELVELVHATGKRLEADDLRPSDLAIPAAGSTLAEVKALLGSDTATKD
ncbi:MAG TPA: hypothetical protein VKR27_07860 [Acidimicrobiales bacterium]|nr:hypothetical protein [Acidimicrobiales bacterium]